MQSSRSAAVTPALVLGVVALALGGLAGVLAFLVALIGWPAVPFLVLPPLIVGIAAIGLGIVAHRNGGRAFGWIGGALGILLALLGVVLWGVVITPVLSAPASASQVESSLQTVVGDAGRVTVDNDWSVLSSNACDIRIEHEPEREGLLEIFAAVDEVRGEDRMAACTLTVSTPDYYTADSSGSLLRVEGAVEPLGADTWGAVVDYLLATGPGRLYLDRGWAADGRLESQISLDTVDGGFAEAVAQYRAVLPAAEALAARIGAVTIATRGEDPDLVLGGNSLAVTVEWADAPLEQLLDDLVEREREAAALGLGTDIELWVDDFSPVLYVDVKVAVRDPAWSTVSCALVPDLHAGSVSAEVARAFHDLVGDAVQMRTSDLCGHPLEPAPSVSG